MNRPNMLLGVMVVLVAKRPKEIKPTLDVKPKEVKEQKVTEGTKESTTSQQAPGNNTGIDSHSCPGVLH